MLVRGGALVVICVAICAVSEAGNVEGNASGSGSFSGTCGPGYYLHPDVTNISTCLACPTGFFQNATADQSFCNNCEIGQFADKPASRTCLTCGRGKASTNSTSACSECTLGRYQPQEIARSYSCKSCFKGRAAPDKNTPCADCAVGKFQ